jgi:hypothetical protein
MKLGTRLRSSFGLAVIIALATAGGAQASTTSTTTSCTAPPVSQPFLSWGDSAWYSVAPGESYDNFAGTGWTLSGGAKIVSTTLADGRVGEILDLPSGAKAVSPATCVNDAYPYLKTIVRSTNHGTANISIAYLGTNGWGKDQSTGFVTSAQPVWTLSTQVKLVVGPMCGWQQARFTLVGTGTSADTEVYNFYLDPRMGL